MHFNRPYSYVLWTKQDYALFLSYVTCIRVDTRGDISPFIIIIVCNVAVLRIRELKLFRYICPSALGVVEPMRNVMPLNTFAMITADWEATNC